MYVKDMCECRMNVNIYTQKVQTNENNSLCSTLWSLNFKEMTKEDFKSLVLLIKGHLCHI